MAFILGRLKHPASATDPAVRENIGQLMASISVVNVYLLVASTGVNLDGAAGAVPFLIVFEGETGVGTEGQEADGCESCVFHRCVDGLFVWVAVGLGLLRLGMRSFSSEFKL